MRVVDSNGQVRGLCSCAGLISSLISHCSVGSLRREATEKKVKFKGNKKVENTDPEDSQDNYNSFNNSFKKIGKTPKHEASFNLYNTESWVKGGGYWEM